jgi:hypothetical protein
MRRPGRQGLPLFFRQVPGPRPDSTLYPFIAQLERAAGFARDVGRDEELDLTLRRWQQAKGGEGRVMLISGEPGIGKSRLTAALSERIRSDPHTRLRYFCSPYHHASARSVARAD